MPPLSGKSVQLLSRGAVEGMDEDVFSLASALRALALKDLPLNHLK